MAKLNGGLFCLEFNKASNSIKTEFDSEPIYKKKKKKKKNAYSRLPLYLTSGNIN